MGCDPVLSRVNLLFSTIVSLIPIGTILKVRMAKGSFCSFFNVFKEMGNVGDLSECLIDRCQGRGAGLALSVGQRS